ncbi:MAG: hypothetical protein J0H68_06545 [Sphingobacteriia bacterium]|nr:hypothetical protein [Sphingobacteriia bacterium]
MDNIKFNNINLPTTQTQNNVNSTNIHLGNVTSDISFFNDIKNGAILNGVVNGDEQNNKEGNLLLKTKFGQLNIATNLLLNEGSKVDLKITKNANTILLEIISINNKPPRDSLTNLDIEESVFTTSPIRTEKQSLAEVIIKSAPKNISNNEVSTQKNNPVILDINAPTPVGKNFTGSVQNINSENLIKTLTNVYKNNPTMLSQVLSEMTDADIPNQFFIQVPNYLSQDIQKIMNIKTGTLVNFYITQINPLPSPQELNPLKELSQNTSNTADNEYNPNNHFANQFALKHYGVNTPGDNEKNNSLNEIEDEGETGIISESAKKNNTVEPPKQNLSNNQAIEKKDLKNNNQEIKNNITFENTQLEQSKDLPEILKNKGFDLQAKIIDQNILKTNVGNIKVEGLNLPINSELTIKISNFISQKPLFNNVTEKQIDILKLLDEFSNINNALQNPVLKPSVINWIESNFPVAGTKLALTLYGFVKLSKSSDWQNIFDDNISSILSNPENLNMVENLVGDLKTVAEHAQKLTHLTSNWQALAVPLWNGEFIDNINFYVKDETNENNKLEEEKVTRFLVEVNTDKYGEIQLDGRVKKSLAKQHSKNFDLIFRSQKPLEDNTIEEVRKIFNNIVELTEINGSVLFQVEESFTINPKKDIQPNIKGIIV